VEYGNERIYSSRPPNPENFVKKGEDIDVKKFYLSEHIATKRQIEFLYKFFNVL
jgi:hypothetical protein